MPTNLEERGSRKPREPRKPKKPAAVSAKLPHAPTPPFYYKANPLRWQCVDGDWLPILGKLRVDLGVNGVDKNGGIDHAVFDAQKRGWQIIPWETTPTGEYYIDVHDCEGGDLHVSMWEEPRSLAGKVLPSRTDTQGYYDWLRWLMAEGHIAQPDPDVLEAIQTDQQRQRIRNLMKNATNPAVAEVLETEREKLADMEHATKELDKPAPKRTRRKKAAKKPAAKSATDA